MICMETVSEKQLLNPWLGESRDSLTLTMSNRGCVLLKPQLVEAVISGKELSNPWLVKSHD